MEQLIEIIKEAGRIMTAGGQVQATCKGRSNFVTNMDVAVQEFLRKELKRLTPDFYLLSEEQENHPDFSRPVWILDPIDGTANFIAHYGQSAISLALCIEGRIQKGLVYNPFSGEMYTAELGKGAWKNGEKLPPCKQGAPLCTLLVDLGTAPYDKNRAEEAGRLATALLLQAADLRRLGSAALALCYVAEGRTGGFLEGILNPWDYAAGALIASEAGAQVGDWNGEALCYDRATSVLAAQADVFQELLLLIQGVRKNAMD